MDRAVRVAGRDRRARRRDQGQGRREPAGAPCRRAPQPAAEPTGG
jgi:hypothetical protein